MHVIFCIDSSLQLKLVCDLLLRFFTFHFRTKSNSQKLIDVAFIDELDSVNWSKIAVILESEKKSSFDDYILIKNPLQSFLFLLLANLKIVNITVLSDK